MQIVGQMLTDRIKRQRGCALESARTRVVFGLVIATVFGPILQRL